MRPKLVHRMRFKGQTLPAHTEHLTQFYLIEKPAHLHDFIQWSRTAQSALTKQALKHLSRMSRHRLLQTSQL